jgi:hypothetical protein
MRPGAWRRLLPACKRPVRQVRQRQWRRLPPQGRPPAVQPYRPPGPPPPEQRQMTPQQRDAALMAAGRLAAEYLVDRGDLPPDVLDNRPPAPIPFGQQGPPAARFHHQGCGPPPPPRQPAGSGPLHFRVFFFFILKKIKISKIYVRFEKFQKYPRSPPIGRHALSVFFSSNLQQGPWPKKGGLSPPGGRQGGLSPPSGDRVPSPI